MVMDRVLDGPLLHVPCAAAGSHPATNLLCYPAGSWYDHGEDIMYRSCITNEYMNGIMEDFLRRNDFQKKFCWNTSFSR